MPDSLPPKLTRPGEPAEARAMPGGSDGLEKILSQIDDEWRSVLARPLHAPGCGCCGVQPPAMNSSAIGQDVVQYLRNRYRAAGEQRFAALMDTRADDPHITFLVWLRGLIRKIDEKDSHRLLADVLIVLDNISKSK